MRPDHLQDSLNALLWSERCDSHWPAEAADERAIHALLRASRLRCLGELDAARSVVKGEILCHDRAEFVGHLRDNWILPSAHYELAAICWLEAKRQQQQQPPQQQRQHQQHQQTRSASSASPTNIIPDGDEAQQQRVKDKLRECADELDKAAKWGNFELDAR
jgi:hypothetical protein